MVEGEFGVMNITHAFKNLSSWGKMEQKLKVSLKEAVKFLEENEYQYAIIGGIALSQWGVVRITRDDDFKILVPDSDYENVKEKLRRYFQNQHDKTFLKILWLFPFW